jgi:alpha-L-arabinofuranosidase
MATVTVLSGSAPANVNSLEHPDVLAPSTSSMPVSGKNLRVVLPPYSCTVVRVKIN